MNDETAGRISLKPILEALETTTREFRATSRQLDVAGEGEGSAALEARRTAIVLEAVYEIVNALCLDDDPERAQWVHKL